MTAGSLKRKTASPASSPEWDAETPEVKKTVVKREQVMLTRVKKAFDKGGAFFFKIPDMPHMGGATRFDIEKPFDAFAVYGTRMLAIEAKALPKMQAFGLRHIRYCQEVGLDAFLAAGGESWVLVGVESRIIPLEWRALRQRFKKGSIKKAELEAAPHMETPEEIARWLMTSG